MHVALVGVLLALLLPLPVASASDPDGATPPIVDQLLAHAVGLDLSAEQVSTLRAISARRARTLTVLAERLRASEAQSSAAAEQDSVTLMQEIGRLRVLSGAEALRQLSAAQRQRWVELQSRAPQ